MTTQSSRGVNILSPAELRLACGGTVIWGGPATGGSCSVSFRLQGPQLHSPCFSHSLLRITALQQACCHRCCLLRINSLVVISVTHMHKAGADSLSPAEGRVPFRSQQLASYLLPLLWPERPICSGKPGSSVSG